MIIWINGAFGSGKTTLAEELARRLPDSVLYDPEVTGFAVRDIVPPAVSHDFQDLPVWRDLVVQTACALRRHYSGPIISPLTLVRPDYLQEIFTPLEVSGIAVHHFWLDVSEGELLRRIEAQVVHDDPQRNALIARWRRDQIRRCLDARAHLPDSTHFVDGEQPTEMIYDDVVGTLR